MKILAVLLLIISPAVWAGNSLSEIAKRCPSPGVSSPVLYSDDFKWGYELVEMLERFSQIYHGEKRLAKRAFVDTAAQKILLPYDAERGGAIVITENFVNTISRHISRAFELKIIDGVFFPDMGHSHLLIPEQAMKQKYDHYPVNNFAQFYRDLFADPQLKILYHTAEQLKMLDEEQKLLPDPQVQWRHHTRNLVGENYPTSEMHYVQSPDSPVNTAHEYPGHQWWGAGFNLSANQNGCFEYRKGQQIFYFDISMYDLETNPEKIGDFDQ